MLDITQIKLIIFSKGIEHYLKSKILEEMKRQESSAKNLNETIAEVLQKPECIGLKHFILSL